MAVRSPGSCLRSRNPRAGIVRSLQLSVGTAALVAVYALTQEQFWTCVMFGFLAYGSYQALQSYRNRGVRRYAQRLL